MERAFQDYYPDELSHCYGCGRLNTDGLHLKSFWEGDETVATFHRYKIVDTRQMAKALSRLEDARKAPGSTKVVPLKSAAEGRSG